MFYKKFDKILTVVQILTNWFDHCKDSLNDGKISFSTFKKVWKHVRKANNIKEGGKLGFAVCAVCSENQPDPSE